MATTTNFGWETPDDTDLVKDGALAMRTLGNAIDTSLVDLKGGTTGQVLSKTSNTDMDFTWVTSDDANAIQNTIVDAKGDLITATGSDVPARLAVGNNGDTLLADSSTSTGLRYNPQNVLANPIINGGFDIWQRGTSIAGSASVYLYTADRWQMNAISTFTVSRQATGDSTNLPNIQYCARVQRNNGSTSTTANRIIQNLETVNSIPYAGKTVTVSFYARKGADFSGASSEMRIFFGSGTGTDENRGVGGYTGAATIFDSAATLTTTWQRFVFTGTVASTATELAMYLYYTPVGTAGANDWFEVTGVQIDVGTYTASSAPTFRRSGGTLQGELAACQRYYWRGNQAALNSCGFGVGFASSATNIRAYIPNPVPMRVTPTSVDFSTLAANYITGEVAITAATLTTGVNNNIVSAINLTSSGLTTNQFYFVNAYNNTAAYLGFSAEL